MRLCGDNHMDALIWDERDGKCGANNIALCLLKFYQKRGFFS